MPLSKRSRGLVNAGAPPSPAFPHLLASYLSIAYQVTGLALGEIAKVLAAARLFRKATFSRPARQDQLALNLDEFVILQPFSELCTNFMVTHSKRNARL